MAQSKVLVDTNSYLRLAQTVRPLLFTPFGKENYCLYILPELNRELESRKLQSKFHWIDQAEYVENRKRFPSISNRKKRQIRQSLEYIRAHARAELLAVSEVDALYISYALELDVPVVTDDQDMSKLAGALKVQVMSTLGLLRIMLDCGHIDMRTITSLCEYWRHNFDLPANFKSDYQRLFESQ